MTDLLNLTCAKCLPLPVVVQIKLVSEFKCLTAVAIDWYQQTNLFWKQAEFARRENWSAVAPTVKELVISPEYGVKMIFSGN